MKSRRDAFTLFELILAVALSAALLAIIGTAINLYLTHVESSRNRVEEAQLARSILTMIADDLRSTAIYQPQDTSSVEQLMASSASFDVDSIDEERGGDDGDEDGGSSASGGSGGSVGLGSSGVSSGGESSEGEEEEAMPLGVTGTLQEMYVDLERLPGGDELFATYTGYMNAPMAQADGAALPNATGAQSATLLRPSGSKTVRYFVRDGDRSNTTGTAGTSFGDNSQLYAGGLVRQEIPRFTRLMAETMGETTVLESGQKLIAPEVVGIEFRYFDGQQAVDFWEMAENKSLPFAIEVTVWLVSPAELAEVGYNAGALLATARQYRQTVFLPMAELTQSGSGGGGSGDDSSGSSSSSSGASSMGGSSSGPSSAATGGSGFGQQSP